MEQILDVGCGGFPKGSVNCDLFLDESPHSSERIRKGEYFIRAHAEFLPFRDNTFLTVYASHVLEHLLNPSAFLREAKRVAKKAVYLQVPSLNYIANDVNGSEHKTHVFTWSKISLQNLLTLNFSDVRIYETKYNRPFGLYAFRGNVLNKFGCLGRLVILFFRQFYCNELTAICSVECEQK